MKQSRLIRHAAHAAWLAPVAALGFALSFEPRGASADLLPLPTITIPGVATVTLPTVTTPTIPLIPTTPTVPTSPTTTTATPTTTAATTTPATATVRTATGSEAPGAAPSSSSPDAATGSAAETVAGAVRLAGGVVSVPVSSVRAPARLVISASVVPRALRKPHQQFKVKVKIADTRAYVVRGARVTIRSIPAGMLATRLGPKRSATNGTLAFVGRSGTTRGTVLSLLVTATDPAKPGTVTASRRIRIPIRPGR